MPKLLRQGFIVLGFFSVLTGVIYPWAVTGCAQLLFPTRANGSLVLRDGRPVGAELIGQPFCSPGYFWGRGSATTPTSYNAAASGGANLGPTNPALFAAVKARVERLQNADPRAGALPVPVDLVTASGSGLDPHISPAAAFYQLSRVAQSRGLPREQVRSLIERCTEARSWGLFGEPRVNVLRLNLALDDLTRSKP